MNYFASKSDPEWSTPKLKAGDTASRLRPLEIPLPSLPKRYRSGDGPQPTAPISMVLKNDSTAQIFEKRVLGGPPKNGELSLQMHYVVGWSDLPAARVAIQAQHILDYVSPRVLEDFEYKLYLEREAREEEEEVAAAIAAVARAEAAEKAALGKKSTSKASATKGKGRGRKKQQRPSKADLIAKKQAEETSFNQSEAAAMSGSLAAATHNASGPSLTAPPQSTPKKKNVPTSIVIANSEDDAFMEEVEGEDEMELDDEVAIHRQLRQTSTRSPEGFGSSDSEAAITAPRLPAALDAGGMQKEQPSSRKISPLSFGGLPKLAREPSPSAEASTPVPQPRSAKSTLQHYGFTPAAKSVILWPVASRSQTQPLPQSPGLAVSSRATPPSKTDIKPPRSKSKKKAIIVEQEEEEQVWEVKRLEGMRTELVDGKPVRLFRVRWKGDWPPDQNPTWEPEDNIDKPLIKEYLARKRASGAEEPPVILRPARPMLKRKYSSVAEAVMGDVDDEHEHHSPVPPGASPIFTSSAAMGQDHNSGQKHIDLHDDSSVNDEDDILQVTEAELEHVETPYHSKNFSHALIREVETSFMRQAARRSSERSSS
ncbi:uncharacterized protein B0I36DRAFT_364520 [Microdochium trichocladiopsis]|uniref:Chromo domain-containing protein n=1 Tax=Microdochium trichocladiopsis TaxID=1682393 RepID=A0A9P8Y032_9PEZI|nr:uncharacterized protein B0I36DRAFT_364520 [Microdochium trichocladiopsis]KAH7027298.1 hypothetical protein B0I36DRAFT_364520 [Microdochium trichocladiopsis]